MYKHATWIGAGVAFILISLSFFCHGEMSADSVLQLNIVLFYLNLPFFYVATFKMHIFVFESKILILCGI